MVGLMFQASGLLAPNFIALHHNVRGSHGVILLGKVNKKLHIPKVMYIRFNKPEQLLTRDRGENSNLGQAGACGGLLLA